MIFFLKKKKPFSDTIFYIKNVDLKTKKEENCNYSSIVYEMFVLNVLMIMCEMTMY